MGSLDAAAQILADRHPAISPEGVLVIATRPESEHPRVIAGGTAAGPLRAACSVAISTSWPAIEQLLADTQPRDTVTTSAHALPEAVTAAAEAAGLPVAHIGTVAGPTHIAAIAIWFEPTDQPSTAQARSEQLATMQPAADKEPAVVAPPSDTSACAVDPAQAEALAIETITIQLLAQAASREGGIDSLTGLADEEGFDNELRGEPGEEATVLIIGVDAFDAAVETYGVDVTNRALQTLAARLVSVCRRSDVVAHLETDRFGVLLAGAERATALKISKRLLAKVAEPIVIDDSTIELTASVGVAHQMGLVDLYDMYESAEEAVTSSQRRGTGRLIIAD